MTPEYLEFRCCMCPNLYVKDSMQCPTGPFKAEVTPCRFVKVYVDERGWKYKVMGGLGESNYKARYKKPVKQKYGWKGIQKLPWRKSFDEAQSDLNELAKKKRWREAK